MAKTELLDGVRVNKRTGLPAPPNTPRQEASLANAKQAGTIDMGTLSTPVTPAKLTVPTPSTGGDALAGSIQTGADQFVQNLSDQRKFTEAPKTQSLQDLISATLNSQGQTELTALEYGRQDGADTAKSELQDINNQLLQEQQGQRRREEAILKNTQGMETSGVNAELQRSRDESLSRQADLSVIQLAKQGKYDSAKEIADRAVAVKMEQEQKKLDALRLNYEENKELFNKAEQREFEVMYGDRKQKMEMEAYKEKSKFDQIIKQNDPLYQAQLAKARREAEAVGNPSGINVNDISDPSLSESKKNSAALTYLLTQNIGQGTRTNVANVLGVINAAEDMAENNAQGKFEGINPYTGILDMKIPFTNIGLPFRETVKGEKQIQNEGYIEAINLRVQTWASGAALTDAQTEQVNRFTPNKSDTDQTVRTKLNNLTNFMLTQAQSQLQSEGINYEPSKVDLFAPTKKSLLAPDEEVELDSQYAQSTPASNFYGE